VQDYVLRGMAFEELCFFDYTVQTYEIRMDEKEMKGKMNDEDDDGIPARGRTRNLRDHYMPNHPKTDSHVRIRRTENNNYLPNIVGPWFPRRDQIEEEEFYYAAILSLLCPWRNLHQLKHGTRSWKEEGLTFIKTANQKQRNIIAGMQYYYDSKSEAQHRNEDMVEIEGEVAGDMNIEDMDVDDGEKNYDEEVIFI
jgi:hypothetical protein